MAQALWDPDRLARHRGRSLVVAGGSISPRTCALVHLMNGHLGNFGKTVIPIAAVKYGIRNRKESTMPHAIVKLWPGKSEQQKQRLADEIAKDVMSVLKYGEESVSVSMEEVNPQDWEKAVYQPDIEDKWQMLYKKPGYSY